MKSPTPRSPGRIIQGCRMNVVTIAIDDLFAYAQFRDSFGVSIETPNLDKLMAQSVNFENAYASIAICAPSRAATLSGKTAFETGVHDNFTSFFEVFDVQQTWPALIRDNGYFATAAGKVFHSRGVNPVEQQAYSEALPQIKSTLTGERVVSDSGKKWAYTGPDEDFSDYDVAQFGIEFLDRAPDDKPFLLNLGFDHPHTPYFNPKRFLETYPVDQIKIPTEWVQGDLSDVPAFAQQFLSQPRGQEPYSNLNEWKAIVQGYLASITHMDSEVGRFLDALAASEHSDDTAILLYSDHGYQLGSKDHPVKFTLWEESAKAPLMIYHPDAEGGKTVSTPVSLMDIMPTLLELTGASEPDGLNGSSLMSFLTGDGEEYTGKPPLTSMYGSFAIRSGDYRYIRYQDGSEELYNVVADPGQIINLAQNPDQATLLAALQTELLTAARDAGAVIDPLAEALTGTDGADHGVASPQNKTIALGNGDDLYFVFENGTEIVEAADGGHDSVYYTGTEAFRMPDHVERVYATQSNSTTDLNIIYANDGDNELHTGYFKSEFYGGGGNDRFFGGGWVEHTFYGGSGNDNLIGARFADQLYGGEGEDRIFGYNKPDQIFGGAGDDDLRGGNDNDFVHGGVGDDSVLGENGADILYGGDGGDALYGGANDDRLIGGAGDDVLYAGLGNDSLGGDTGNDTLISSAGDDYLDGGAGIDLIQIGRNAGHSVIKLGSADAERIEMTDSAFGDFSVYLVGDRLHLWLSDTRSFLLEHARGRNDVLAFSDGERDLTSIVASAEVRQTLQEGYGDQSVTGTGHGDYFLGLYGDDFFNGKGGDDRLFGGWGNDTLNGSAGEDQLFGGRGDDLLQGANDADIFDGGVGSDTLIGGKGSDTYRYRLGDGNDLIDDRGFGDSDKLVVQGVAATEVKTKIEGSDLLIEMPDGAVIRILQHSSDRGRIEELVFDGTPVAPGPGTILKGTDSSDQLIGTSANETLIDGGGVDNLYGKGGADIFRMSKDGDVDSIKDFEIGGDVIDVSAWGVSSFSDLNIVTHETGKSIISFGKEVLSVNDGNWTLPATAFTVDDFIFSATPGQIQGTDSNDKLVGTEEDEALVDGAGKDNLFGRGGADVFKMDADGEADSIKDFQVGQDKIDISAWGVTSHASLDITTHSTGKSIVRFGAETLSVNNGNWTLPATSLTADQFIFASGPARITGTAGNDRLIGSNGAETLYDDLGNDNLYGRGGADVFEFAADGATDSIKDFESGVDRIDISAWGVQNFAQLDISTHKTGKAIIRYEDETLSVNNLTWTLPASALSDDDFIFT